MTVNPYWHGQGISLCSGPDRSPFGEPDMALASYHLPQVTRSGFTCTKCPLNSIFFSYCESPRCLTCQFLGCWCDAAEPSLQPQRLCSLPQVLPLTVWKEQFKSILVRAPMAPASLSSPSSFSPIVYLYRQSSLTLLCHDITSKTPRTCSSKPPSISSLQFPYELCISVLFIR